MHLRNWEHGDLKSGKMGLEKPGVDELKVDKKRSWKKMEFLFFWFDRCFARNTKKRVSKTGIGVGHTNRVQRGSSFYIELC